ncbi:MULTISPECIES: alkaline phosphatase PhoX [Calothrix]|uniref:DUF839 domain-containing protein n=2 Tax=Calothrix TaxID=1186 RepID=A0ABR8AA83_9CYAN|nr:MULTISPECIES: alkaline phosphatase PhoX [Calothrix]MBD2196911.1 DUF839 domain-containing protein [Calothrix parietina FACHB-288]MBD2225419.1 DUF839 domain-containing protein [Calothrix anomala FACHB-343]
MNLSRRNFFKLAGASAIGVTMVSPLEAFYARVASGHIPKGRGFGALEPKFPENVSELKDLVIDGINLSSQPLLKLPPGFKYRALSIKTQQMSDGFAVPAGHDGMAAFPGKGKTTILVRNHELGTSSPNPVSGSIKYSNEAQGGTTTIVIGRNGEVIKQFSSLAGTIRNCAGGPTPWDSWISCEETFSTTVGGTKKHGYNFEVVANANSGLVTPVPLVDMGRFSHEAVAVDPKTHYIYETEDRSDSCFYRFVPKVRPKKPGDLARGGTLYALKIKAYPNGVDTSNINTQLIPVGKELPVEWVKIDDPDPIEESKAKGLGVRYEAQRKGAAIFFRGEGAWYGKGLIYFISTQGGPKAVDSRDRGNGQIWVYNPRKETLTLLIEASPTGDVLDEPDNVTVSPFGDLFLCEDGGGDSQYVVGVNEEGEIYQFAFNNLNDSEFAGACFSPDGKTLFVNIQSPGITYAISGPWKKRRAWDF